MDWPVSFCVASRRRLDYGLMSLRQLPGSADGCAGLLHEPRLLHSRRQMEHNARARQLCARDVGSSWRTSDIVCGPVTRARATILAGQLFGPRAAAARQTDSRISNAHKQLGGASRARPDEPAPGLHAAGPSRRDVWQAGVSRRQVAEQLMMTQQQRRLQQQQQQPRPTTASQQQVRAPTNANNQRIA